MKKLILFSMFCALATVMNAQSQIWHVDPNCSEDNGTSGSGLSWNDPCSFNYAVQQAVDGDQIWVKKGSYQVNVRITASITIYGGFNGTESSVQDRDLADTNNRTLFVAAATPMIKVNPNLNTNIGDFPNFERSLEYFHLDGVTLRAGNSIYAWGGAIRSDSVENIILTNLWVDSNAAFKGGGFYIENSAHGWMENVLFTKNVAVSLGGGMFLSFCPDFTLVNVALCNGNFSGLSNTTYPYAQASGGFYFERCHVEVHNLTATGNRMDMAGCIGESTVNFYNSIIYPDYIHVFYNHDSTVSYNNCCLWTTNQQQLQGWNPIPYMGDWNNVIWDYDIHNIIITDNIFSIDPQFNSTPLVPNLMLPELSPNSPCRDAAGSFESFYPGNNFDVLFRNRFEDILDLGAFEYHNNNNE